MSKTTTQARAKAAQAPATALKSPKPGAMVFNRIKKTPPEKIAKAFAAQDKDGVRTKTLRLDPTLERGLALLKGIHGKPINKMVNEAVGEYISSRAAQEETRLAATLEQLQAYRRLDPEFLSARRAVIEAEARYGNDDPMEGSRVVEPAQGVPSAARFVSRTRAAAAEPVTHRPEVGKRQRS